MIHLLNLRDMALDYVEVQTIHEPRKVARKTLYLNKRAKGWGYKAGTRVRLIANYPNGEPGVDTMFSGRAVIAEEDKIFATSTYDYDNTFSIPIDCLDVCRPR